MRDGKWRYRFTATAPTSAAHDAQRHSSESATVVLAGDGDPGYHFTAVALAEVVMRRALHPQSSLAPTVTECDYPP